MNFHDLINKFNCETRAAQRKKTSKCRHETILRFAPITQCKSATRVHVRAARVVMELIRTRPLKEHQRGGRADICIRTHSPLF
jgi:hypothetical protein